MAHHISQNSQPNKNQTANEGAHSHEPPESRISQSSRMYHINNAVTVSMEWSAVVAQDIELIKKTIGTDKRKCNKCVKDNRKECHYMAKGSAGYFPWVTGINSTSGMKKWKTRDFLNYSGQ